MQRYPRTDEFYQIAQSMPNHNYQNGAMRSILTAPFLSVISIFSMFDYRSKYAEGFALF